MFKLNLKVDDLGVCIEIKEVENITRRGTATSSWQKNTDTRLTRAIVFSIGTTVRFIQ